MMADEEMIETLRVIIIGGCYRAMTCALDYAPSSCDEAISCAPCGYGGLGKGQVTQKVLDKVQDVIDTWTEVKPRLDEVQNVIDTWTTVRENLQSLGMKSE
jgi:hypothetical protein